MVVWQKEETCQPRPHYRSSRHAIVGLAWFVAMSIMCQLRSTEMNKKGPHAGRNTKLVCPASVHRARSKSVIDSALRRTQVMNGRSETEQPYSVPVHTQASHAIKYRSFRSPTQQFVNGQWWSMRSTQHLQILQ